jgi:predicted transcriptional regulator
MFCSFGYKCDAGRPDSYEFKGKRYCCECLEIARKGHNQLQAKVNELIETLKSKYEDKVEAEILEGMITDIKLTIIGEEESESEGDSDW